LRMIRIVLLGHIPPTHNKIFKNMPDVPIRHVKNDDLLNFSSVKH